MKLRPTIFLSGVSSEFASFRDAVEVEIQKKGCFAENRSSFPPDYRTVEAMLRQRLSDADAVIYIVGFRNSLIKAGPAAIQSLLGRSTVKARANNMVPRRITSSKKRSPSSAMKQIRSSPQATRAHTRKDNGSPVSSRGAAAF